MNVLGLISWVIGIETLRLTTTTFGNGLNKVLEFWIEIEKDQ